MLVTKQCDTLKQAEKYQWSLYSKYDRVELITFPTLSEKGIYQWQVSTILKSITIKELKK